MAQTHLNTYHHQTHTSTFVFVLIASTFWCSCPRVIHTFIAKRTLSYIPICPLSLSLPIVAVWQHACHSHRVWTPSNGLAHGASSLQHAADIDTLLVTLRTAQQTILYNFKKTCAANQLHQWTLIYARAARKSFKLFMAWSRSPRTLLSRVRVRTTVRNPKSHPVSRDWLVSKE